MENGGLSSDAVGFGKAGPLFPLWAQTLKEASHEEPLPGWQSVSVSEKSPDRSIMATIPTERPTDSGFVGVVTRNGLQCK